MLSRIKNILGLNKRVDKLIPESTSPKQLLPPPEVKIKEVKQEVYERNKKLYHAIREDMAGGLKIKIKQNHKI